MRGRIIKSFLSWVKPEFARPNLSPSLMEATRNLVAEVIDLDRIKNEKFMMLLARAQKERKKGSTGDNPTISQLSEAKDIQRIKHSLDMTIVLNKEVQIRQRGNDR